MSAPSFFSALSRPDLLRRLERAFPDACEGSRDTLLEAIQAADLSTLQELIDDTACDQLRQCFETGFPELTGEQLDGLVAWMQASGQEEPARRAPR